MPRLDFSAGDAPLRTDPWRSVDMAAAAAEVSWLLVWMLLLDRRPRILDGTWWGSQWELLDVACTAFVVYVIFAAPILFAAILARPLHRGAGAMLLAALLAVGTPVGNAVMIVGTLMTILVPIGVFGWPGAALVAVLAVLPRLASWGCLLWPSRVRPTEDPTGRVGKLRELASRQGLAGLDIRLVRPGDVPYSAASTWQSGRGIVYIDPSLVEQMDDRELTVLASHEMAHLRLHHVRGTLLVDVLLRLVSVALAAAAIWPMILRDGGWWYTAALESAPVAALWLLLAGLAVRPVELAFSRRQERQANLLALQTTEDPAAFISGMTKLAGRLGATRPLRGWERWFPTSHPSLEELTAQARRFADERGIPLEESPQEESPNR